MQKVMKNLKDYSVWSRYSVMTQAWNLAQVNANKSPSIRELDQEENNKYLQINEGDGRQHAKMKEKKRVLEMSKS